MSTDITQLMIGVGADTSAARASLKAIDKTVADMRNQILSLNSTIASGFSTSGISKFTSAFKSSISQINGFKEAVTGAGRASQDASQKTSGLWDVFAGSFIANMATQAVNGFMSSLVEVGQIAFDSYVSYERMGDQLQTMNASQIMAAGGATTMADALTMAQGPTEELMNWMTQLATISIYREEDIAMGLRTAQVFGFTRDEAAHLVNTMVEWGSATGATQQSLDRVIYALGQINSLGHLTAAEVRQLANAGVPAMEMLSQATGKTTDELRKLMRQGAIPADEAIKAIVGTLDRDFAGSAERSSHSMLGLVSAMKDLVRIGARNLFGPSFEAVQPYLDNFVTWARSPEVTGGIIAMGELIGDRLGGALEGITNLIDGVGDSASNLAPIGNTVAGVFTGVWQFVDGLLSEAYAWGANFFGQLASGMMSSISSITQSLGVLGDVITYWLEPHSPPNLLPNLDKWGADSATVWANGWADADFSAFEGMSGTIEQLLRSMFDGTEGKLDMIDTIMGSRDTFKDLQEMFNDIGSVSEDMFARVNAAAGPVGDVAEQLARAYVAWQQESSKVAAAQAEVEAAALKVADAQAKVEEASKGVEAAEQELAEAHELVEHRQLRAAAAANIVERAQDRVAEATKKVAEAQDELTKAQDASTDAQNALNDAMDAWQKQLDPLESDLDAVEDKMKAVKNEMRRLELEKIIAGEHDKKNTPLDKELAQLELQAMALEESIDLKEKERDVATEAARKKVEAAKAEEEAQKRKVDLAERGREALEKEVDAAKELEKRAQRRVEQAKENEKAIRKQVDAAKELEDLAKKGVEAAKEEEKAAKSRLDLAKDAEKASKNQIEAVQGLINVQKEDNKLVLERINLQEKLKKEMEKAEKEAAKKGKGGSGGGPGGPKAPILSPLDLSTPEIPKPDLSKMFDMDPTGPAAKVAALVQRFLDLALAPFKFIGGQLARIIEPAITGTVEVIAAVLRRITGGIVLDAETIKTKVTEAWNSIKKPIEENVGLFASAIEHGFHFVRDVIDGDIGMAKRQLDLFFISLDLLAGNLTGGLAGGRDALIAGFNEWTGKALKLISDWAPEIIRGFGNVLVTIVDIIGKNLPFFIEGLKKWGFQLLDWIVREGPNLLKELGAVIGRVLDKIGEHLPAIVEALAAWGKELWDWVVKNGPPLLKELGIMIGGVITWIAERVPSIATELGKWAVAFIGWVPGALVDLIVALGLLFGDFLAWITKEETLKSIGDTMKTWGKAFSDWILNDAWPAFTKALGDILTNIGTWITEKGPNVVENGKKLGSKLVDGLWQALKDLLPDVRDFMVKFLDPTAWFIEGGLYGDAIVPGGNSGGQFNGVVPNIGNLLPGGGGSTGGSWAPTPPPSPAPRGPGGGPQQPQAMSRADAALAAGGRGGAQAMGGGTLSGAQKAATPNGQRPIVVNVKVDKVTNDVDMRRMAETVAEEILRNNL
jgi:tape measure domain-containing protein